MKNYDEQLWLPIKRINSTLEGMMEEGFTFLQDWTMDEPHTPERIMMPSKRIMDVEEINKASTQGDKEATDAQYFYNHHVRRMDLREREKTFPIYSFIDEKDIQECEKKYGKAA